MTNPTGAIAMSNLVTGLLWYDGSRRTLEDKIIRAAQRYREKYGRWPDTCYVHSRAVADLAEQKLQIVCKPENDRTMLRVLSAPNILLHHLWLGESIPIENMEER
jgi:hypothetical protein